MFRWCSQTNFSQIFTRFVVKEYEIRVEKCRSDSFMNPDSRRYNNVIELKLDEHAEPLFEEGWLELQQDLERLINDERCEQKINYIDNYDPIEWCEPLKGSDIKNVFQISLRERKDLQILENILNDEELKSHGILMDKWGKIIFKRRSNVIITFVDEFEMTPIVIDANANLNSQIGRNCSGTIIKYFFRKYSI